MSSPSPDKTFGAAISPIAEVSSTDDLATRGTSNLPECPQTGCVVYKTSRELGVPLDRIASGNLDTEVITCVVLGRAAEKFRVFNRSTGEVLTGSELHDLCAQHAGVCVLGLMSELPYANQITIGGTQLQKPPAQS